MRRFTHGFTLIEMAMVLGLMAIMMGFGMEALNSYTNVSRARDTVNHLETVKAYLDAYAAQNNRYPCPARKDRRPGFAQNSGPEFGEETCNTSYVTQVSAGILAGTIPVRTLNLPEKYAGDKWNNKITYVVTQTLTSAGGYTSRRGDIEVHHGTPANNSQTLDYAAYLLISHGANGSADNGGATGMKELSTQSCTANASPDSRNCVFNTNRFYIAEHNPTETATVSGNDAFFDDHVLWGTNLVP